MKIGTLGSAEVAQAFARNAVAQGHEVVVSNSRGAENLRDLSQGFEGSVSAANPTEAMGHDVVLLAMPEIKVCAGFCSCPGMMVQRLKPFLIASRTSALLRSISVLSKRRADAERTSAEECSEDQRLALWLGRSHPNLFSGTRQFALSEFKSATQAVTAPGKTGNVILIF